MSANLALSIVNVVQAVREGVVLIDELQELADMDGDITEAEADQIIDHTILEIRENIDNNAPED